MKRAATIFFLSIYLLSTTEAYQVLKLPMLVHHYLTHKRENPSLSLLGFLKLHYSGPTVYDADYDQDMKLPFKTRDNAAIMALANDVPAPLILTIQPPVPAPNEYFMLDTRIGFHHFPNSVFQPPRA